jgi:rod shape-determining protein MreC
MANGSWKIARGKGSAQLPLAIFAVLAIVLLLAGRTQILPFDRARTTLSDWSRPVLEVVSAPVDAVGRWLGGIGHFFNVYSENIKLKQQNARLRQWQSAALALEARMKRYQLLLNAVPDPSLSSVTARVIGRASRPFLQTTVLNAGKHDGVKPGQAVTDDRGMLGRIYLAGDRTSWVILLTDLNSRIPVAIQPGNAQAIMAGDNSDAPALEALSQNAKLKQGEEVVTSGDGGLLPPGLPVGVVINDGGQLRVALFADPATADEVRIVDFKAGTEQVPAPTINDLPAAAAGYQPQPSPPVTTPAVTQSAPTQASTNAATPPAVASPPNAAKTTNATTKTAPDAKPAPLKTHVRRLAPHPTTSPPAAAEPAAPDDSDTPPSGQTGD